MIATPQQAPLQQHTRREARDAQAHSCAAHRETHTTQQHTQHNNVIHIHTQHLNLVHTQTFDIRALAALARVVCARRYLQKKFAETAGCRQCHPPSLKVYTSCAHKHTAIQHTHTVDTHSHAVDRGTQHACTAYTYTERQHTERRSNSTHTERQHTSV